MSQRPLPSVDPSRRGETDRAPTAPNAQPGSADAALETFWLHVRRGLLIVSALWLVAVPVLLWVRRAQGALAQPPSWPVALVFGLALIGTAALWRSLSVTDGDASPASETTAGRLWNALLGKLEHSTLALAVPTPALVATVAALTFSGANIASVVLLWVLVAVAETAAWGRKAGNVFTAREVVTAEPIAQPQPANHAAASNGAAHSKAADHRPWEHEQPQLPEMTVGGWPRVSDVEEEANEETEPAPLSSLEAADHEPLFAQGEAFVDDAEGILPNEVLQQWTRSRLPDGSEQILATLRAELAAGQRTASIHLAFCPPLADLPELEFEQVDGPDARIQQGELFRHGARLDVRLAEPTATACSVVIELAALSAASADQTT